MPKLGLRWAETPGYCVGAMPEVIAETSSDLAGAEFSRFDSRLTLPVVLEAIIRAIEAQTPGTLASILLLVPDVPSTNAQTDIMDGYPTMGSARAGWVSATPTPVVGMSL